MTELKKAYDEIKKAEQEGAKRRVLNELIENYQRTIKNSSYDWEKVNGKEVLARIEGNSIFVFNLETGKEEQVK